MLMNRNRARGMIVGAVAALVLITYIAPLSPSQLYREEDIGGVTFDMEGVVLDIMEMSIENNAPGSTVVPSIPAPLAAREIKSRPQIHSRTVTIVNAPAGSPIAEMDDRVEDELEIEDKMSHREQEQQRVPTIIEKSESLSSGNNFKVNVFNVLDESPRMNLSSESVQLEGADDREIESERINSLSGRSMSMNSLTTDEVLALPVPFATLPLKQILQQQWVNDLQQVLKTIPQGLAPVSIVSADYKFRDVLINWIIAAQTQASPPITHVIVFSLDQAVCELLKRRQIPCIFVFPSDFLTSKAISSLTRHVVFSEIMVLRLTAMRLINHWGFDVANYDTDAIILKSPESLYLRHADSHMIGSYGHHPGELGRKWGTTVCCGLFMTRCSPYTEIFWNTLSTILPNSMNDQARLNFAIAALQPDWGNTSSKSILKDEWVAMTPTGFKVTVLPSRYICRQECSGKHRSEYYVWHKGGLNSDGKMKTAQKGRLWYLSQDWESSTMNSSATGEDWLREITAPL